MRVLFYFLFVFISFQNVFSEAASAASKKYFDMPVREWLGLSGGEKVEGARELLSLNNGEVPEGQIEAVVGCMNAIGKSPVWIFSTVGALLTKCSFDMGVSKSSSTADWDALVTCVKKEVPDFSNDELFSLGLSAAGASLAKDSGSDPILTPRTKKILEVMSTCGKNREHDQPRPVGR